VREPIEGGGKKKWSDHVEGTEFIFPKKYSKTLRPIFTQDFDWAAKEENGTITIIFTPKPPASNTQGTSDQK
jgi:hypothetical protein